MALSDKDLEVAIRSLYDLPFVHSPRVFPGGDHVTFIANIDETFQAYLWQTLRGGYSQLTDQKDPVSQCLPNKQGTKVALLRDEGGNELYRLSLLDPFDPAAGEQLLTPEPLGRVGIVDWLPGGEALVLAGNDERDNFLALCEPGSHTLRKLLTSDRWLLSADLSDDGRHLAVPVARNQDDPEDYDIAVFALDRPEEVTWLSTGSGHRNDNPRWAPGGSRLAFTAEIEDATYMVVYSLLAAREAARALIPGDSPDLCYWDPGGAWLDFSAESQGTVRLFRARTGDELIIGPAPFDVPGSVHGAAREGDRVALAFSAFDKPPTSVMLAGLAGDTLTVLNVADLGEAGLGLARGREEWIKTKDGSRIHCWVLGETDSEERPGLVYVHGGPTWAVQDAWRRDIQSLFLAGFTVIAPNFRGSTGFGPVFRKANLHDLGGKDLEDCLAAGEWLRKRSGVDPTRVGITGASYGGYMTLWALTRMPEAFACGAATVPVPDWVQDYELADASFRYFDVYFFGGTPEEKPDLYRERSPVTFINQLNAPLFISAGRNDSRCPFRPIETFVEKGWELGKQIEFDVQEEEGHGAGRKTAAVETELKLLRFLRRQLRVGGQGAATPELSDAAAG
jgi:dipeptidyl aminopeptidase/acylaminoacyl peptidase